MLTSISNKEKVRLLNAFPASIRQDVEVVVNIIPGERNVVLTGGQIHLVEDLIHQTEQKIILDGEELIIPYRLYFNETETAQEKDLTPLQATILSCIYLRHHNGFVRQARLERLIDTTDYFVIPFTIQLLGEYVMEILEVLDKHINDRTLDQYVKFISDNKKYWQQTESRVISYWNEYYKRPFYPDYLPPKYPMLKDYIGQRIVKKILRHIPHS